MLSNLATHSVRESKYHSRFQHVSIITAVNQNWIFLTAEGQIGKCNLNKEKYSNQCRVETDDLPAFSET